MKKLLSIFLFFCLFPAKGQLLPGGQVEDFERKKSREGRSSAFISINIRSTEITGDWPLEIGGSIEFIGSNNLTLGFVMYSKFTTDVNLNSPSFSGGNPFLMYFYGGTRIGYFISINDYLHLNLSTLLGLGTLSYNYSASVVAANIVDRDWYYMTEPGASLGIRIYGRYYINFDLAFRLPADADFFNINNSELRGMVVGGGIRVYLY